MHRAYPTKQKFGKLSHHSKLQTSPPPPPLLTLSLPHNPWPIAKPSYNVRQPHCNHGELHAARPNLMCRAAEQTKKTHKQLSNRSPCPKHTKLPFKQDANDRNCDLHSISFLCSKCRSSSSGDKIFFVLCASTLRNTVGTVQS